MTVNEARIEKGLKPVGKWADKKEMRPCEEILKEFLKYEEKGDFGTFTTGRLHRELEVYDRGLPLWQRYPELVVTTPVSFITALVTTLIMQC